MQSNMKAIYFESVNPCGKIFDFHLLNFGLNPSFFFGNLISKVLIFLLKSFNFQSSLLVLMKTK